MPLRTITKMIQLVLDKITSGMGLPTGAATEAKQDDTITALGAINAQHLISTVNSTNVILGAAGTFSGTWEDVTQYTSAAIAIKTDNATDGTLWVDVSQDGGVTIINSVPFTVTDTTFFVPKVWNIVESHIRIRYVNGTTAHATWFGLTTKYSNSQQSEMLGVASNTIRGEDAVTLVKSINTATDPNGDYKNAQVSGIDDNNSSTATLGSGATFTGTWTDISEYAGITCLVDGTSGGVSDGILYLEFSHDGVTVNRSLPRPILDITSALPRTIGKVAKFFRVKYINGTTATTSFDLQTTLNLTQVELVSTTDQVLKDSEDVKLVRPVSDHNTERNTGLLSHQESKRKFGLNNSVGTGGHETIWSYTANWIPNQVVNEKLRIKAGGDAADDAAGLGAQSIEVCFLDENWNEVEETIVTNGVSASLDTTANCVRLISARVINVGTYHGANTAAITFELNGSGNIMGYIALGVGNTEQAITSVPAGKTMYITEIFVSVGQSDSADVHLHEVTGADVIITPFKARHIEWSIEDFSGANVFPLDTHLKFDEKSDVWFEAQRITGSGSARVSVDFNYYLKDN